LSRVVEAVLVVDLENTTAVEVMQIKKGKLKKVMQWGKSWDWPR